MKKKKLTFINTLFFSFNIIIISYYLLNYLFCFILFRR